MTRYTAFQVLHTTPFVNTSSVNRCSLCNEALCEFLPKKTKVSCFCLPVVHKHITQPRWSASFIIICVVVWVVKCLKKTGISCYSIYFAIKKLFCTTFKNLITTA